MQTIKLQQRGVLTLPKKLRDALELFRLQAMPQRELEVL